MKYSKIVNWIVSQTDICETIIAKQPVGRQLHFYLLYIYLNKTHSI